MDGPNKGQKTYASPQSGWTPQGIKILVHKVDGPNKGQKTYISPQSGRTLRGIMILVHKVDGPNKGQKTYASPQSGRTQQWSKNLRKSTEWTDPTRDQDSSP